MKRYIEVLVLTVVISLGDLWSGYYSMVYGKDIGYFLVYIPIITLLANVCYVAIIKQEN